MAVLLPWHQFCGICSGKKWSSLNSWIFTFLSFRCLLNNVPVLFPTEVMNSTGAQAITNLDLSNINEQSVSLSWIGILSQCPPRISYTACSLLCLFLRIHNAIESSSRIKGQEKFPLGVGKISRLHRSSHGNKLLILQKCMGSPALFVCFSDWCWEEFQTRGLWYLRSSLRLKEEISLHRAFENRNNKANRLQHSCYCCCYYCYYCCYLFSSFLGTVHWRSSAGR